jgi:hypothetical protein
VSITTHGPEFFTDMHRRTVELRGSEKGVFEYAFTTGAHRPHFVTKPVARWLERQLDFPKWTDEDIAAMPTTHISQWARAGGVELDRLYASEEREGGAMAIGENVPAPSREVLSVFTPEQWERQKDWFIYESWLKAARAQLAPASR